MTRSKSRLTCKPRFRIMLEGEIALGPGKVDLLEAIEKAGSISGAARNLDLSYKRAWELVDTMNRCFKKPLIECASGGKGGGGAKLTLNGLKMVELYRSMENKAETAISLEWEKFQRALRKL